MKRRSSTSVKKILHSGHTFSTHDSFPPGVLPTKRHVIERILHLKNFRTFNAANDIAREIYDKWVWCNVYPIHLYTISKKVQSFVNCFSALDRWSKKKRGEAFLQKEKEFMSTIDEIFDVFCADDKQRRILEKQHGLKMTDDDYAFYKDQTSKRVGKCVDQSINQSINLFICFVLQNKKYTNICEKKFSKAQEGSEMTIRSSSQLPPSK